MRELGLRILTFRPSVAALLAGQRKIGLDWDWFWTRPWSVLIDASVAATVSKLLTVSGGPSEWKVSPRSRRRFGPVSVPASLRAASAVIAP
jgi:hypothetical protein